MYIVKTCLRDTLFKSLLNTGGPKIFEAPDYGVQLALLEISRLHKSILIMNKKVQKNTGRLKYLQRFGSDRNLLSKAPRIELQTSVATCNRNNSVSFANVTDDSLIDQ